ncbi:lipopolysaccharide heptosyltransferase I [Massilia sp. W12]|uniref:lipopolysaccharide heptosyltransferase I n=1 Tax=Massilia sp. W12 TaxID=3126507 RepID=UPI0030CDA12D
MKILLIRVSSLGDVVHNMPLAHDLLQRFPGAHIDWVVEEAYVDLLRLCQGVGRIIPYALRRWRKNLLQADSRAEMRAFKQALQQEHYDYAFECQGLLKTGLILGLARASHKIGLGNASEGSGYEAISRLFHSRSIVLPPRTHAVARARLMAAAAFGPLPRESDLPPADFMLRAPQVDTAFLPQGPYICFFHGTAGAAKKWPRVHWQALAHKLQQSGCAWPVLLAWGNPAEQEEAQAMAAGMPQARVLPRLSMLQAVALAANAAAVIGVDTGLTHIAAAYRRPVLELYCASPRWKTEGNWDARCINLGDAGAPPDVEQVWQAWRQLGAQEVL